MFNQDVAVVRHSRIGLLYMIVFMAFCLESSVAFAQIHLPNRAPQVEAVKVETAKMNAEDGVKYILKINYLNGFKPNEKVVADRRIVFVLNLGDGEKRTFTTKDFEQKGEGASLSFDVKRAPEGNFKAYLCRHDQCRIVRQDVRWN